MQKKGGIMCNFAMARIGHHRIVIKTPKIHKKPLRRNDNDNSLPSTVLRSTN